MHFSFEKDLITSHILCREFPIEHSTSLSEHTPNLKKKNQEFAIDLLGQIYPCLQSQTLKPSPQVFGCINPKTNLSFPSIFFPSKLQRLDEEAEGRKRLRRQSGQNKCGGGGREKFGVSRERRSRVLMTNLLCSLRK